METESIVCQHLEILKMFSNLNNSDIFYFFNINVLSVECWVLAVHKRCTPFKLKVKQSELSGNNNIIIICNEPMEKMKTEQNAKLI